MVTSYPDSGRIVVTTLLGQVDPAVLRMLGMAGGCLLALFLLSLSFYFGEPTPRRPTTDTEVAELSTTDAVDSAPAHPTLYTRNRFEVSQIPESEHQNHDKDASADERAPERSGRKWGAAVLLAVGVTGIGLVGVQSLLELHPLTPAEIFGFRMRLRDVVVGGGGTFDAVAADTVRYLVFAAGVLAVLEEPVDKRIPGHLTGAAFVAAVALPSGVLLASGVEPDVAFGVSMARAAVCPAVALLAFQRAYSVVAHDSTGESGTHSQHPLVRRVSTAFLRYQRLYGRLTGTSIAVVDERECHALVRRTLLTTGLGAALVWGVWFVEALLQGWEYAPTLVLKAVLVVGELVQVVVGGILTTLVLTALVLSALWLTLGPVVVPRALFAVGAFSITGGILNVFSVYLFPVPAGAMVGRVVAWTFVAPQPGATVVWLLDMLNTQWAVVLVGLACGTHVIRETTSESTLTRTGSGTD